MVKGFRWGGVRLVVGFCYERKANGGMNDVGRRTMEECVWMGVCVCVCMCDGLVGVCGCSEGCGWDVGGGGAMLMSAPFYSLTSRSNYLAYPGSSINVFQPPSPLTPQHHAVAHSRVSVRPFEGSKNPFPSTKSACCHTYILYYIRSHIIRPCPQVGSAVKNAAINAGKPGTIFFLVVTR